MKNKNKNKSKELVLNVKNFMHINANKRSNYYYIIGLFYVAIVIA